MRRGDLFQGKFYHDFPSGRVAIIVASETSAAQTNEFRESVIERS